MSAISRFVRATGRDIEAAPTCNAHWICAQLGYTKKTDACRERYINRLIDDHGFPKPLPHEAHGGGISSEVNAKRSQWVRVAVERWLGDYLPPDSAAALEDDEAAAAAADMDAAAENLVFLFGKPEAA